jgi:hypothetical protein
MRDNIYMARRMNKGEMAAKRGGSVGDENIRGSRGDPSAVQYRALGAESFVLS